MGYLAYEEEGVPRRCVSESGGNLSVRGELYLRLGFDPIGEGEVQQDPAADSAPSALDRSAAARDAKGERGWCSCKNPEARSNRGRLPFG
jgi:hypothetical protein